MLFMIAHNSLVSQGLIQEHIIALFKSLGPSSWSLPRVPWWVRGKGNGKHSFRFYPTAANVSLRYADSFVLGPDGHFCTHQSCTKYCSIYLDLENVCVYWSESKLNLNSWRFTEPKAKIYNLTTYGKNLLLLCNGHILYAEVLKFHWNIRQAQ